MNTQTTLIRRQNTLDTLRSSGALYHWHPLVVDAALDLPAAFHDIDTLVGAADFLAAVDRLRTLAPSLDDVLCSNVTTSLRDRSLQMERPFLRAMRRSVLARMKLTVDGNRLLAEEIDERARAEYLRMAARYMPGRIEVGGRVRTFGFKAFLEMQLPYKMRDIVCQCVAAFGQNDHVEHLDQRVVAPARTFTKDMGVKILCAIRKATRSPREVQLLSAFLSENGTFAEFADREGVSVGKLRREIEAIFIRAAEELAGEGAVTGAPRLLHCRKALQDMAAQQESSPLAERYVSRRRRYMLGIR